MNEVETTKVNPTVTDGTTEVTMDIPAIALPAIQPILDAAESPMSNKKSLGIIGLTTLAATALTAGSVYLLNKIIRRKKKEPYKIHTFDNAQSDMDNIEE